MTGRAARFSVILAIGFVAWVYASAIPRTSHAAPQPSTKPAGFAVVELFTSQGCSSCPPAEKVLADLADAAERDGRPIYTLAFHVDYFNRLGWADPFSDQLYTRRQIGYAKVFKMDDVYTPQTIVNGRVQYVGSKRDLIERAVGIVEKSRAPVTVSVEVHGTPAEGYKVRASFTGINPKHEVNVAVVERGLSTDVKAGENRGRHLEEPSVVRWFTSVSAADAKGEIVVPPLPKVKADHASVVVYVQRPGSGPIDGAGAAPLP